MDITIVGLFGHFNYNLSLFDHDGRINILTGPNGFGKSTILRCIRAVGESDLNFFADLEFEKFQIHSNQKSFSLEKKDDSCIINGTEFSFDEMRRDFRANRDYFSGNVSIHFYREDNYFEKVFPMVKSALNHDYNEVFEIAREAKHNAGKAKLQKKISDILQQMAQIGGTIYMIQEQRLVETVTGGSGADSGKRERIREVIEGIPEKLKNNISQAANAYSKKSTDLDSSLPYRLLDRSEGKSLSETEFNALYREMRSNLEKLRENGISDMENRTGGLKFSEKDAKILRVLLDDFNEKYDVYRPLMEKLSLFQSIVNRRLMFKRVRISEEQTLIVEDDRGRPIPLKTLSSGEKEILVLFYKLIFETKPGSLLLIDEPEISLHLAWQKPFVRDLQKIADMNDLQAVIATHSSSIIGGHRDIQIDLGELYQNGQNAKQRLGPSADNKRRTPE